MLGTSMETRSRPLSNSVCSFPFTIVWTIGLIPASRNLGLYVSLKTALEVSAAFLAASAAFWVAHQSKMFITNKPSVPAAMVIAAAFSQSGVLSLRLSDWCCWGGAGGTCETTEDPISLCLFSGVGVSCGCTVLLTS